jgi:hypothetical protein
VSASQAESREFEPRHPLQLDRGDLEIMRIWGSYFVRVLIALVFAFALCESAPAQDPKTARQTSGSSLSIRQYRELGPATEPCEPAVCEWWERLRTSANDYLSKGSSKQIKNFINIFAEGLGRDYRVPVADQPPRLIAVSRPIPGARARLINGKVALSIEVREDGGVGSVEVTVGLRADLDDACIRSFRQSIFLPAVKDGRFIVDRSTSSCTFAAPGSRL